ncbi:MAG TPA: hypothetical protein VH143_03205 [Kofleriaceae bacterium]|jgi:hypothetical protein|nr:hypothetical protein [Kofleriaceae bacterium]
MSDDRPTVDLPKPVSASRYSVKRAITAGRASSPLIEHVTTGSMRVVRGGTDPGATGEAMPSRWKVEMAADRITLRGDGVSIELSLDEARRVAEAILRAK